MIIRIVLLAAVLAVAACSDGDGGADDTAATTTEASTTSTTSSSSLEVPEFTGDADSAFCRTVAEDRPVADPFEPDIEPREVELRLRALLLRTEDLLSVAPPELDADIAGLLDGLRELDRTLETYDHDFAEAAEAGADVVFTNDPAFATAALRIGAYRDQVCGDV